MMVFGSEHPLDPDSIGGLIETITEHLRGAGVDVRASHHVALVVDELLTNLHAHGSDRPVNAEVKLAIHADRIEVQVSDDGTSFDPRSARAVNVSANAEDREIGGLGLLLIKSVTDELTYQTIGQENRTTFSIRREKVQG